MVEWSAGGAGNSAPTIAICSRTLRAKATGATCGTPHSLRVQHILPDSGARTVSVPALAVISIVLPMRPSAPHTVGAVYGSVSTAARPAARSFDWRRAVLINIKTGGLLQFVNPSRSGEVPHQPGAPGCALTTHGEVNIPFGVHGLLGPLDWAKATYAEASIPPAVQRGQVGNHRVDLFLRQSEIRHHRIPIVERRIHQLLPDKPRALATDQVIQRRTNCAPPLFDCQPLDP